MGSRRGRRILPLVAPVLAIAASACFGGAASPAPSPSPSPEQSTLPAGTRVIFRDDFNGSKLDARKWDTCYPWANSGTGCTNHGNNELEWYLPEQIQVSGGAAHLVAAATPTSGTTRNGQPATYPWRSGMLTTYRSLAFTYGYVEVVARVPKGDGFWPALWLLPRSQAWPPEIDFHESYGDDTLSMYPNYHSTTTGQHQGTARLAADMSAGFHTYAVDWGPGSLTWYVDGKVVHTYTQSDVPSEPMYVLANLAISGTYPPSPSTPATASFDIERVSVYQR
jgi:beta-glucanase (GH16 family)